CLVPQYIPINQEHSLLSRHKFHYAVPIARRPLPCVTSLGRIGMLDTTRHLVRLSSSAPACVHATTRLEGGEEGLSTQATTADPTAPSSAPSRKRRPPRTLYRGDPGMWSWVLHRISGATIFFFLFVHVLDAAMLRVSPQTYNAVLA